MSNIRDLPALPREFYSRATLDVARDLVGAILVRRWKRGQVVAGRIVEVEAYIGEDDPACHASHGLTPRTEVMYGPPGHAYVYFTYGMHFLLNAVTESDGFPAAVLIRGVEPLLGIEHMRRRRGSHPDRQLTNGPAKLCSAFDVDLGLNRTDLTRPPLYIARSETSHPESIRWTPRIGIRHGKKRRWRCLLHGNAFVSK